MDSPPVVALLVFFSIYIAFFLIRVLADMVIVAIALLCAVVAYNIYGSYTDYRTALEALNLLSAVGVHLPDKPTGWAVFFMASLITVGGVLICIPFLPFSATYRQLLGAERLNATEEDRIKLWISEEVERMYEEDQAKIEKKAIKEKIQQNEQESL